MDNNPFFCLKSNEFKNKLSTAWQRLRCDSIFCDVTLACEDKQISAHKAILSANSPVLNNLLAKNPHPHPLIYLRRVKHEELAAMLDFMYFGEVTVAQDQLNGLLVVAEDLGISDFKINSEKNEQIKESKIEDRKKSNDSENHDKYSSGKKFQVAIPNIVSNLPDPTEEYTDIIESENNYKEYIDKEQIDNIFIDNENIQAHQQSLDEHTDNETKKAIGSNLNERIDDESKEAMVYFCKECDYVVNNIQQLEHHIERRHNLVSFLCDECDFTSASKFNLRVHINAVHKNTSTEPMEVDNCCDSVTKLIWKRYSKVNNGDDTEDTAPAGSCNFCGDHIRYKASNLTGMARHLESKHPKEFKIYARQKKYLREKKAAKWNVQAKC